MTLTGCTTRRVSEQARPGALVSRRQRVDHSLRERDFRMLRDPKRWLRWKPPLAMGRRRRRHARRTSSAPTFTFNSRRCLQMISSLVVLPIR